MSYTPTTEMVKTRYAIGHGGLSDEEDVRAEAFDRWLAEHDRQVAERAWDEGLDAQKDYAWRCEDADAAGQGVWVRPPENPYRVVKGSRSMDEENRRTEP